jgi:two-component system, chemotaxis family, chemotaxis protein CheY
MGKKVIVIDDSKTVRDQVRLALEGAGYQVVEAFDGQDGFSKIRDTADLAMAICDVNMPGMSGIAMLEALKNQGVNPQLPIIMLTTEGEAGLIQKAKLAGARAWLVKPFQPDQLVAVVAKIARSNS